MMNIENVEEIIKQAVEHTAKTMEAKMEDTSFKVGRKLQEESQEQFSTLFRHVLNVDPTDPKSVKEFQRTINHAEDMKETHKIDRRNLRKGIFTVAFAWASSMVGLFATLFYKS